jgi:hypothetical protein
MHCDEPCISLIIVSNLLQQTSLTYIATEGSALLAVVGNHIGLRQIR